MADKPATTTNTPPANDTKTVNDPTHVQRNLSDPVNVGTHPDSFYPADMERDFEKTNNPKLDEHRWLINEFFEARGPSHAARLDDLHHGPDASDRHIANRILNRADLLMHPRAKELEDRIAQALSGISDPRKWLNPYKDVEHGSNNAPKR